MKKQHHAKRRPIVNVFGQRVQFFIWFVSWFLLVVVSLAAASLHLRFWLLDIYASFTPQIFLFAITLYIVLVALYGRFIILEGWIACWRSIGLKEAAMFAASTFFTFYIVTSSVTIIRPVPQNTINHNLTVGTYNKLYKNDEIYNAAYFFKNKKADVIAMQEADPRFVEETRNILGYDYVEKTDCDCSAQDTEVAIISKYPLENTKVVAQHKNGAIIRTEVKVDYDTKVAVYALHIPPPFNSEWYGLRNEFFSKLSQKLEEDKMRSIVMGDFNTTIFSPVMQEFIKTNQYELDNMSETVWPECSWNGYSDVACARIDHVFVSRQFGVGRSYIGEGYGSDHKPVVVELLVN